MKFSVHMLYVLSILCVPIYAVGEEYKNEINIRHANVLLIHMFKETSNECKECDSSVINLRVKSAFTKNGIDARIFTIEGNNSTDIQNRITNIYNQINRLALSSKNLGITHIIFAGHGSSENDNMIIGDLYFSKEIIEGLKSYFGLLRFHLAKKIKIFLYGCATFQGTDKEILNRSMLLKSIFDTEKVEIFGYHHNIYSNASKSFAKLSLQEFRWIYCATLFLIFFRTGLEKGTFPSLTLLAKILQVFLDYPYSCCNTF